MLQKITGNYCSGTEWFQNFMEIGEVLKYNFVNMLKRKKKIKDQIRTI